MKLFRALRFASRGLHRSGPPVHLTLFVTGACNLRCRHCFHWREVAEGVSGPSAEEVGRLADSAARLGPLLWVSFGGGEPFLRKDLPELARSFGRHGLAHLAIPTNGLVDRMVDSVERIATENPETYLSVAVSIDGPPDVHDAIRAVAGGHARSCAAVRRLARSKERHPNLGVGLIFTVTRENQDTLADHVEELVRELEPDNVTINLAREDALDRSLLEVDTDRYREVVDRKRRLQREGRIPYFDFPLARVATARDDLMYEHVEGVARGRVKRHLPCTAGQLSAVVFENGDVRACEVLPDTLGNLNDTGWDLAPIWKSAEAARLRERIEQTRCSCTWECAQADNVLFQPKLWPKLARKAVSR